ncbi:hypothetical protein [Rhodococcus qingshengii]|uniref:hypothetical protein n=1 Tax=Rhodococcus qingshengii TaxID=334542 RepID=UPI00287F7792|nr:hypothetical protein [Rhodococcus qingshengii]
MTSAHNTTLETLVKISRAGRRYRVRNLCCVSGPGHSTVVGANAAAESARHSGIELTAYAPTPETPQSTTPGPKKVLFLDENAYPVHPGT